METKKAFSEASVYVGTYAKYSQRRIYGDWLNISDYDSLEDFLEACRELHDDEDKPVFMFQDWVNIPDELISEGELSPAIFELEKWEVAPFLVWLKEYSDCKYLKCDLKNFLETFRDQFCGEWKSERAYAEQLFDESYYEIPKFVRDYIDFDALARDLFRCDHSYIDGYVFRD